MQTGTKALNISSRQIFRLMQNEAESCDAEWNENNVYIHMFLK